MIIKIGAFLLLVLVMLSAAVFCVTAIYVAIASPHLWILVLTFLVAHVGMLLLEKISD